MSEKLQDLLEDVPEDVLRKLSFSMPWQTEMDADFRQRPLPLSSDKDSDILSRQSYQIECWNKFCENPQVSTAIRGLVGRLAGKGFRISCKIGKINDIIKATQTDYRNRLYTFWPKYVARAFVEGELFLVLTLNLDDDFIEVDFLEPETIDGGGLEHGIIYHPTKTMMPLIYNITPANSQGGAYQKPYQIPSIFLARNPGLLEVAKAQDGFNNEALNECRSKNPKVNKLGGFFRFVVSWDRSFLTRRNISYLRTVLKWLNHYEQLKMYEIDHKKSAGAFVWVGEFADIKAWKVFISLSDDEMRRTGLGSKLTPGGRLYLPPGMTFKAVNPTLPKISEADTDILHMITGGLNEPEDIATGQSKGTFASVKASRGPMSDRIQDEINYWEKFLRYDFWGSIFFLKSKISDFPEEFSVKEAVEFSNKKPKIVEVKKKAEELLEMNFPATEIVDVESGARAWLGVKHGSTYDVLGISNETIAKKIGINNYHEERLKQATEDDVYPELVAAADQEMLQEQAIEGKKKGAKGDGTEEKGQKDQEKGQRGQEPKSKQKTTVKNGSTK
jgi:hypothetical protein